MGFAPIPAVIEPPKSLGPPTVVLVHQTSDNPIDVPKSLDKFGIFFLTFPGTFHPSCRHYRTSEIKKCGSELHKLYIYFKSKLELFLLQTRLKVSA